MSGVGRRAVLADPSTGRSASSIASATVVGPDLTIADAYATALFVKGVAGLAWLESRVGYDGYVITHDGSTSWTAGFNQYKTPRHLRGVRRDQGFGDFDEVAPSS